MGMADLRAADSWRFGSSRSLEFHDPDHCGDSIKRSFIALGGPYIHPIVKLVLDRGLVLPNSPLKTDQSLAIKPMNTARRAKDSNLTGRSLVTLAF